MGSFYTAPHLKYLWAKMSGVGKYEKVYLNNMDLGIE
jgi:hypothetical protein